METENPTKWCQATDFILFINTTLPKEHYKIWFTIFGSLQPYLSFFSKFATKLKTDELAFSIESQTVGALGSVDPTRQHRAQRGTIKVRQR